MESFMSKNKTKGTGIKNMSLNKTGKLSRYFKGMFKSVEIECEHKYTGRIVDAKVCMLCGKTLETEIKN
jgi:hypothetical protein